jgi:hypothetical protein
MPAKRIEHLCSDACVVVRDDTLLEPSWTAEAVAPYHCGPAITIEITNHIWLGAINIVSIDCPPGRVWLVDNVSAEEGWGPLLHDIAMEIASRDDGLSVHRRCVTPNEESIWQYYFDRRKDVQAFPLEAKFEHMHGWPPLDSRYVKRPSILLDMLTDADKIVWGEWDLPEE